MINKKEIFSILIVVLIISFAITLIESMEIFLVTFLTVFLVIMVNIAAKKVTSFYLDSEIEIKLWEIQQYGFKPHRRFKRPFPAGAFLPLISKVLLFPLKGFVWMASLVFEVKPKVHRAAKRHGLYTFSEMTESQIGLIAASGILVNIIFAVAGYLLGFEEFANINIYYAFFNMIPVSSLDGNKIFFGNIVLWATLATIVLIGLASTLFIL